MRTFQRVVETGLVLALLVATLVARLAAGEAGQQKPAVLNRTIKVTMKYLLYLPKDYEQKPSWPLMLFLHGSGAVGDNLELIKRNGPPKLIEAGRQFPFIVVSPQCPRGCLWQPIALDALLDEIVKKYKVDQDRIYLTGLSMEGYGPGRWRATSPIVLPPSCPSVAEASRGRLGPMPMSQSGSSTVPRTKRCPSGRRKKWSRP